MLCTPCTEIDVSKSSEPGESSNNAPPEEAVLAPSVGTMGQAGVRRRQALSAADVARIRAEVLAGPYGIQRRMAREHGVSDATISHIVNRRTWATEEAR